MNTLGGCNEGHHEAMTRINNYSRDMNRQDNRRRRAVVRSHTIQYQHASHDELQVEVSICSHAACAGPTSGGALKKRYDLIMLPGTLPCIRDAATEVAL